MSPVYAEVGSQRERDALCEEVDDTRADEELSVRERNLLGDAPGEDRGDFAILERDEDVECVRLAGQGLAVRAERVLLDYVVVDSHELTALVEEVGFGSPEGFLTSSGKLQIPVTVSVNVPSNETFVGGPAAAWSDARKHLSVAVLRAAAVRQERDQLLVGTRGSVCRVSPAGVRRARRPV